MEGSHVYTEIGTREGHEINQDRYVPPTNFVMPEDKDPKEFLKDFVAKVRKDVDKKLEGKNGGSTLSIAMLRADPNDSTKLELWTAILGDSPVFYMKCNGDQNDDKNWSYSNKLYEHSTTNMYELFRIFLQNIVNEESIEREIEPIAVSKEFAVSLYARLKSHEDKCNGGDVVVRPEEDFTFNRESLDILENYCKKILDELYFTPPNNNELPNVTNVLDDLIDNKKITSLGLVNKLFILYTHKKKWSFSYEQSILSN